MLQAVGGSMLNPVAMGIVTNTFIDPRERAQAVGMWGAMFGLSMALGPVVGGALVSGSAGGSIFWLAVPVGVAAIVLTLRYVPESRAPNHGALTPSGRLLVIALLSLVTFGVIEAPQRGWGSPVIVGRFALAGAALLGLLATSRAARSRWSSCASSARSRSRRRPHRGRAMAAFGGFLFLNTLYLQDTRGLSPVHAGLLTLPVALMIVIVSPLSGRIVGRGGPRLPLLIAGSAITAAARCSTGVDASTSIVRLLVAYLCSAPASGSSMRRSPTPRCSGMPRARASVAAAIATTSRQVGQTLGVAGRRDAVAHRGRVVDAGRLRRRSCSCSAWSPRRRGRGHRAALNPEALVA